MRRYQKLAVITFALVFVLNSFPALRLLGEPRAAERLFWVGIVSALMAAGVAAVVVLAVAIFDRMTTSR
jgi:hypothetical protein